MTSIVAVVQVAGVLTIGILISIYLTSATRSQADGRADSHTVQTVDSNREAAPAYELQGGPQGRKSRPQGTITTGWLLRISSTEHFALIPPGREK